MGQKNTKQRKTGNVGSKEGEQGLGERHYVLKKNAFKEPFPRDLEKMYFGTGCFWGAEKLFWRLPGVYSTAVGFQGGKTVDPSYNSVCSGRSGHNEVVQVVFDPKLISVTDLLRLFWRCHDPTQGNRQGNDRGTQYRSGIYCATRDQYILAIASKNTFEPQLAGNGYAPITTEITDPDAFPAFYYAEDYHQQYLAKPGARLYCSAEPTGVALPAVSKWAIDDDLKSKYTPVLPDAFWSSFNGSISAPNKQEVWDKKNAQMEADEKLDQLKKQFNESRIQLESSRDVIIQFCGGCGFLPKAQELAASIENMTSKTVGLLQEFQTTGNFDVMVRNDRASSGSSNRFIMLHSKRGRKDHGFVDSAAKKQLLIEAIKNPNSISDTEDIYYSLHNEIDTVDVSNVDGVSSPGDIDLTHRIRVEELIESSSVVIFSKSYCPYCKKAKLQFSELGIEFTSIELDEDENGEKIQSILIESTGIATVPIVYVDGELIGDSCATVSARQAGKFDRLKKENN